MKPAKNFTRDLRLVELSSVMKEVFLMNVFSVSISSFLFALITSESASRRREESSCSKNTVKEKQNYCLALNVD